MFLPLPKRLVIVRQRDSMRPVPHPIHRAQRRVVKRTFTQVVFQDDAAARNTRRFTKELRHVRRVVKHVDKKANIDGLIRKGKFRSIERPAGHPASRPRNDFDSFNCQFGPALRQQARDRPVTATDIKDAPSLSRNQRCQRIRKNASPAAKHQCPMAVRDP